MARLINDGKDDQVAFSIREEQIVIDVLLFLYMEGVWDKSCQRVATSFLEWVIVYRDSLEQVFDEATRLGFQYQRFSTKNPDGWRETAVLKGVPLAQVQAKKDEHRAMVLQRRSRKILITAERMGIPKADINGCFQNIQHEPDIRDILEYMTTEMDRMQKEINELKARLP